MKKRICILLCAFFLFAWASAESGRRFVFDETGVFTAEEIENLEAAAAEAYDATGFNMYFAYFPMSEASIKDRTALFVADHAFSNNSIIFSQTDEKLYVLALDDFAALMPSDFLDIVLGLDDTCASTYETASEYIALCRNMLTAAADTPIPATENARLVDEDDLLTPGEESRLLDRLDRFAETSPLDIAVIIPKSLNGKSPQAFADDYYDYNGYGNGENDDGVLFLICMEDRDMAISTYGYGITVFTDYGIEKALSAVRPYLSEGDFAGGIGMFIDRAELYLQRAESGEPYDLSSGGSSSYDARFFAYIGAFGVIIAFFITLGRARKSTRSIRRKAEAGHYLKRTPDLRVSDDIFLGTTVTKTRIPESNSSSGGGSSTHTSSSGRSHGGGSGKF